MRLLVLFMLALGVSLAAARPSLAGDASLDCDRLVAADDDRDNPTGVAAVDFSAIDVPQAVAACRIAVAKDPKQRRNLFHLGRALEAASSREAVTWYEQAAALGDTRAMANLALVYSEGDLVPRDPAAARRLLEKASNAGDLGAMTSLGLMLESGGAADRALAYQWYRKAADAGHAVPCSTLPCSSTTTGHTARP